MTMYKTIDNSDLKYNVKDNKLDDSVLSEAWQPDALQNLGGWLELAGIDPLDVFKTGNIEDHPYIGKKIYFKFLDDAGYPCEGTVINCMIHPRGRLMFDIQFSNAIPDILYPVGQRQEFTLIDRGKYNGFIERMVIDQLQNFGMEVLK